MITSKSNELIKHVKSLNLKKNRDAFGEYIVEGSKMIKEVMDANLQVSQIIICQELLKDEFQIANQYLVEYVSQSVFQYISDMESPQGILAVVKKTSRANDTYSNVIFALDHVQDPGNLGTIIRTLDATGIQTLILSEGCADEYNQKVIRSTMGAIFRVSVFEGMNLVNELKNLHEKGYQIIVTALDANSELFEYTFPEKCVIVIGNESKGVSQEIQEIANIKIKIPMIGKTESLNAGVAASLMAYEVLRKRKI